MERGSSDTDFPLVRRVMDGDTSAFRILVERYKDVSFSLACSVLKDETEAEDVLQEVFLKVYGNIRRFRFDSSFSTWLYRIVVNACLNQKEKNKRYVKDGIAEVVLVQSENREGFEKLQEEERKKYIEKTLHMMKEDEALLLRLYYLCDLSIADISKITDLGESNIKVILFRARKNMHDILNALTGNDLKSLL